MNKESSFLNNNEDRKMTTSTKLKTDITRHNDNELSMLVMNDDYYYCNIDNPKFVLAEVDEEFIYTDKQKEVLIDDMEESYMNFRAEWENY